MTSSLYPRASSDGICIMCNLSWSNVVIFVLFLVLSICCIASLAYSYYMSRNGHPTSKAHLAIAMSGAVCGVFKCVQISLTGNPVNEAPLAENGNAAFVVIFLLAPRISTAALATFYSAVLSMWHSALQILVGTDGTTVGVGEGSRVLLPGRVEVTVGTAAVKASPIMTGVWLLLAFEYAFVLGSSLAMVWQNQENVTAADEIKDVLIYVAYVVLLSFYCYKLCTSLAALSASHQWSLRSCFRQALPCLECCFGRRDERTDRSMHHTETLQYVLRQQADQKIYFVATVSFIVAFAVVLRFIKCVCVALVIIKDHPVIPSNASDPVTGLGWLAYYCLGELSPFVGIFFLTLRTTYFRRVCCVRDLPEPADVPLSVSHSKDYNKAVRITSASFLEDGSSGAGGYTDLLVHDWVKHDSSGELVRGYDYLDDGLAYSEG